MRLVVDEDDNDKLRLERVKASFYIPENWIHFLRSKGFKKKIPMKLFYQYTAIFFNFPPTPNHLHLLQV